MTEKVFSIDKKSMKMEEATLPYISMLVDGEEINLLHGYCSSLDVLTVRESITPLSKEQSFSVVITENQNTVKKVKYEVININDGKTVEEGAINALDVQPEYKVARIKLKEKLTTDMEYVLRITLVTDNSKRIYFYTRVKVMDSYYLPEKLAFVQDFHNATFSKDTADDITKYLEKPYDSLTSFSKVTIRNDYDAVTYGTLNPIEVFKQVPTISEIGNSTASIRLNFMLKAETGSGQEYYRVTEDYRFMYTSSRCYLYDYNRSMESVFDVGLTSLSKSEFKIGITNNPNIDLVTNSDKTTLAFVRERALWSYSVAENKLTEVFSFYQAKTDFIRDTYESHDIRILRMDDTGNLDFIVYGYMNRGEYEGRVGIVLYHYDRVMQRVEELAYIPINTTYGLLNEEIGTFCYSNNYEVFYIHLFDTIYSYNLTAKTLKEIAHGVTKDSIVFSRENKFVAYQEVYDSVTADSIQILDLESGKNQAITAGGKPLRLLGLIDQNIIYGIAPKEDNLISMDGTVLYPMKEVYIVDSANKVQKKYKKDNYYIIDAQVNGNVIELKRLVKNADSILGYEMVDSDFILNTAKEDTSKIQVTKRVTDQMLTEYYISMNLTKGMTDYPELLTTQNTIITEDRTVRVNQATTLEDRFITYAFGNIEAVTPDIGTAIQAADKTSGIVLSSSGQVVWERGVKSLKNQISGISMVPKSEGRTSLQACIKMLLAYRNSSALTEYNRKEMSVVEYLSKEMNATPVKAEKISLDQVLYFIYRNKPVIALKKTGEAVLITGYDSSSIIVSDPASAVERRYSLKEASAMFEEAGNVFITYIE
ncbi:MAG: hypothetical protein PUC65_03195 [Clostridiales bacterium]|nr:hypothetical protein [Clostridiales bacterium]